MTSKGKPHGQHRASVRGSQGPRVASQPLIDVSNWQGVPAPQNGSVYNNKGTMDEFLMVQEARVNEFLQHSETKVEEHRSSLRQVADHLSTTAANFGHTIAHWIGHPAAEQAANFHRDLQKSHAQYVEIDNQYRQLKLDHEALQKQLQESNSKLKHALEERDEQRRVAESANWTGSVKVSDDAIRSKWKQLNYNIRSMARALAKCQMRGITDTAVKDRFSAIVPRCNKLLSDNDYKEYMLTAYLWVCLEEIFWGTGEIWGGDYGASFKRIRDAFVELAPEGDKPSRRGPSLRHVARWSAQGAAFFTHFLGRDEKAFRDHANVEIQKLKSFCNLSTDKSGTDFLREMKNIMEGALEIDEMMMNSKAIFSVRCPVHDNSKSLRFDPVEMEAIWHSKDLSSKTTVHFFISPMLIKKGNADGFNYDSRMVLCKASTVCH